MTTRSSRVATFCFAIAVLVVLVWTPSASAAVRLPRIFSDNMVLQQGMAVPVWGWADEGEKVTVSFAGQQKTATADLCGKWMVRLDSMPADKTPRELTVTGENTLTFKNVLVGEVWLCGGQSNMEFPPVSLSPSASTEEASATNSTIRYFWVEYQYVQMPPIGPMDDVHGKWVVCSPATVGSFPATPYFFGREIASELDVPVGLIRDTWTGTGIEPWIPPEGFAAVPEMKDYSKALNTRGSPPIYGGDPLRQKLGEFIAKVKEWVPQAEAALGAKRWPPPMPTAPDTHILILDLEGPAMFYYSMIEPIMPCAIRGVIWYQGEANGNQRNYFFKMKALFLGWRRLWGEGDFPIYFVQLPNFSNSGIKNKPGPEGGDGWAFIREAQLKALTLPNTGMAVTIDVGEANDIHTHNKQDVGKRLALWALAKTYNKNLVFSGPLYKNYTITDSKVRITFDYAGSGLMVGEKKGLEPVKEVAGGKLKWFAIAGADKVWHWADAILDGDAVVVRSDEVPKPVAVRYAYAMDPEGANLYNKEGLPASPFRTDDW